MKTAAQIVSWIAVAMWLIAMFGLYGSNPNLVRPENLIPLVPPVTALAVYHFAAARWFKWLAFSLNCFAAFIGLVLCIGLSFAAAQPVLLMTITLLPWLLPTTLNTITLWSYLSRKDVVPAGQPTPSTLNSSVREAASLF